MSKEEIKIRWWNTIPIIWCVAIKEQRCKTKYLNKVSSFIQEELKSGQYPDADNFVKVSASSPFISSLGNLDEEEEKYWKKIDSRIKDWIDYSKNK